MKTRLTLAAAAAGIALLTACSSGSSGGTGGHASSAPAGTSAPAASSATTTGHITISNFAFSPSDAVVAPGATVTVTNNDATAHTVTDAGVFDTKDIAPHATATFTAPTAPGTYAYMCTIHQFMHGTLTVR